MNSMMKSVLVWLGIIALLVLAFRQIPQNSKQIEVPFSTFYTEGVAGKYKSVTLSGFDIEGTYKQPFNPKPGEVIEKFRTVAPPMQDLGKVILSWKTEGQIEEFKAAKPSENNFAYVLMFWAPLLVFVVLWFVFMRQAQMGGNKAMSFGKARAKGLSGSAKRTTFADVAGCDEAKEELKEIVEFLKDPAKFLKLGGKIPKGVLLMGPPGTGKTLLARAIAGEAKVQFFSISGSDFVEMFVGVGASRVRDLFEQAKKSAPCIVFIDEIDAVGRHRGAGLGGGHDEREQTLNQLLVEMDGFEGNEGVILVAATNRPDVLDPALLRPGRFDRRVVVDRPDVKGRFEILKVHTADKIPLSPDVDLEVLARGTPGFAGADLANLCNEAALTAARGNKKWVEMHDFENAKDKVYMGTERRSLVMTDEDKRITAYHEAGHTVVAAVVPQSDPLHKVTIIPRGRALGVTWQLPLKDRYNTTREYMESRIAIAMGGRIAEEIFFNQLSTGASNDIQQATDMAKSMVMEYGMSDKLGPLNFGGGQHEIFLGRDFTQHREISEDTARMIDSEVHEFVMRNYRKAKAAIESHRDQLVAIAEALLVRETLDGNDIEILMKGGTLPPPKAGSTPTAPATVEEGHSTDPGLNPALKPA
ncbi:MAG: ATP-dependent zinc metalloprotease FtsH [Geothrix sp.]|nr:ATP-dependent zinc metalloprotease FtsH [Holophagaceae bacterium]MBP7618756.1 ATP-dependent zinc metalloprotease FtsH [Geothrix sp.]